MEKVMHRQLVEKLNLLTKNIESFYGIGLIKSSTPFTFQLKHLENGAVLLTASNDIGLRHFESFKMCTIGLTSRGRITYFSGMNMKRSPIERQ
jgi:hypothetical protein